MTYTTLNWLHVLSATLLLGTALGTAFHLLAASLSRRPQVAAAVARHAVRGDRLFTAALLALLPLTGWVMLRQLGLPWSTPWITWATALFGLALACWLPLVRIQIRMRDLAEQAAEDGDPLPPAYFRLLKVWAALGVPAVLALVAVVWLMVARPMG